MRKIIASEYVTLDGVMADPGGGDKTPHGGWSFQFWSEEAAKFKFDELFASDALLLGRVTYEGFAAAWPAMTDTGEFGERMNGMPKYVVSTTLETAEWNNSHIVSANIVAEIAALKDQPGQDILLFGSSVLFQTVMQNDLVDEVRLMVHPVVLGGGKRLFADDGTMAALKLIETQRFSSGIVVLRYEPKREA
jgi:dihydrofolate reductase